MNFPGHIPLHLILISILLFCAPISAHMTMSSPAPLRYRTNPYKTVEDYDYSSPLSPSGSNYPCKGYHVDMGTPSGQSVATWSSGGTYDMVLAGSATHLGGSCQASLSFDEGASWSVVKSWIGGCVKPDPGADQTFSFTLPTGLPSGDALFAWTWFNNQGNREMYMNCAVVTISGGRRIRSIRAAPDSSNTTANLFARAQLPTIFTANIGNGCSTAAGKDVAFPNPGSQFEYGGNDGNRAAPIGNCAAGSGGSGISVTGSGTTSTGSDTGGCSLTSSVPGLRCNGASPRGLEEGWRWRVGYLIVGTVVLVREMW